MSGNQNSYSTRTPSGVAASVQKRRTLYLAESDPRVKGGSVTKYQNDYYADIKVLSDSDYVQLLKSQIGLSFTAEGDPIAITDVGAEVSTLHPPTNFSVTYETVNNNGVSSVTATINFDAAVDSAFQDGESLSYGYTTPTLVPAASAAASTLGASALKPIDTATITFPYHSSGHLAIKWKGYSDAIAYLVTVTAKTGNLFTINSSGTHVLSKTKKVNYPKISSKMDASGMIVFTVPSPVTLYTFSGEYDFSIQVVYAKGTSAAKGGKTTIV
jgi:hypothetical protein